MIYPADIPPAMARAYRIATEIDKETDPFIILAACLRAVDGAQVFKTIFYGYPAILIPLPDGTRDRTEKL